MSLLLGLGSVRLRFTGIVGAPMATYPLATWVGTIVGNGFKRVELGEIKAARSDLGMVAGPFGGWGRIAGRRHAHDFCTRADNDVTVITPVPR